MEAAQRIDEGLPVPAPLEEIFTEGSAPGGARPKRRFVQVRIPRCRRISSARRRRMEQPKSVRGLSAVLRS
jgi:hypothetical protein